MNQKSNNYIYLLSLYILLPIAIAKLIWSGALYFLDKDSLLYPKESDYLYHYNINLAKSIIGQQKDSVIEQPIQTHERVDDIKLKGTYESEDESFIVIEDNLGTTFLYLGEKYVGYKLVKVYDERAVLEKDGRKYDIVLTNEEDNSMSASNVSNNTPSQQIDSGATEFVPGEPVQLTRNELNSYVKNPNKIWKNIRIQELRRNGTLDGFRVNYVKKGSFFDKAGMKSGDIIKSIDGKEIKTLSDVMKYYSEVETLDGLTLGITRGNEEIDLEFNVN